MHSTEKGRKHNNMKSGLKLIYINVQQSEHLSGLVKEQGKHDPRFKIAFDGIKLTYQTRFRHQIFYYYY